MSPYQHGEVYVLDDGAETDLDLGHYERFIDMRLNRVCNITTGQVYAEVISKERRGDYLGGTIQVIPHITNEIKRRIAMVSQNHRRRDRAGGGGRDGGRYRKPAIPRGHPPAAQRPGPRKHLLHPRHLAALDWRDRRAEDQTHPALGARAALDRHLARI